MILSNRQILAIRQYRKKKGKLKTIYELLLIPEISISNFISLKPFLKNLPLDEINLKNNDFKKKLEIRYRALDELFNNNYFYSKIYIQAYKKFYFNLSLVKKEFQKAFYPFSLFSKNLDQFNLYRSYSFGIYLQDVHPKINFIALFDYQLKLGQHLLFGSSYGSFFSDHVDSYPIKKANRGIISFTDPNRIGVLRGIALSFSIKNINFVPFIFFNEYELALNRFNKDEVNLSYERLINDPLIIYFDKKNSKIVLESGFGFQINFLQNYNFQISLNFAYLDLSKKLNPQNNINFNYNNYFRGDGLFLGSFYFDWNISKKLNIYSEIALSTFRDDLILGKRISDGAIVNGLIWQITSLWLYSSMFRYLGDEYFSPHSAFVIKDRKNTLGWIQGLEFGFYKGFSSRLYIDIYRKLNQVRLNVNIDFKSCYKIKSKMLFGLRFTFYEKYFLKKRQMRIRSQFNMGYWLNNFFYLKLLYEKVYSKRNDKNKGYFGDLAFIKIKWYFFKSLQLSFRLTFYQIEDFLSRIFLSNYFLSSWYSGLKFYINKGLEYDLALHFVMNNFFIGIQIIIDYRKSIPKSKIINKFLLQMKFQF